MTRSRSEDGIAMIWALLVVILMAGIIAMVSMLTMSHSEDTKRATSRVRASIWVQSAADDLVQRISNREIGFSIGATLANTDQLLIVPTPAGTGPAANSLRFENGTGNFAARQMVVNDGTTNRTAWYQVLPAETDTAATPWRALYVRNAAAGDGRGTIQVIVRVWEDAVTGANNANGRTRAVTARITFRHDSLARFSVLGDDSLDIGGLGSVTPGGYVHTNNSRTPTATAIKIDSLGVNLTSAIKITSSYGGITDGTGTCGTKCKANINDVVDFGAAATTMRQIDFLSQLSTPAGVTYPAAGIARVIGAPPAPVALRIPAWQVFLNGPDVGCGANQIGVSGAQFKARDGLSGLPLIDDRVAPTIAGTTTCYNVAQGGGAFVLDGDVIAYGRRASSYPVTLAARRVTRPLVQMDVNGDGVADTPSNVTAPASIFVVGRNNLAGSTSDLAPIGLVAEANIYLPSYAMGTANLSNALQVANVAAMAASGEISYGPAIASISSDDTAIDGYGILPLTARNLPAPRNYGWGASLSWQGSLASRRPIVFRYGTAAAGFLGYGTRSLQFVDTLLWNPPPVYPGDRDWYSAEFQELTQ